MNLLIIFFLLFFSSYLSPLLSRFTCIHYIYIPLSILTWKAVIMLLLAFFFLGSPGRGSHCIIK
ncbi:hypothetical protein F5X96DRAFT_634342 [Biscogniauxia mediterranea]|nr:hypothetical protein F5X96DRAFT_634342 [Biscogniauxia mediterranea]